MSTPRPAARLSDYAAPLLLAATMTTFLAASSAPTPLYRLYQEAWGFSPVVLTLVFAVYAFSLLAALLTVGGISDHIGRRPTICAALLLQIAAMGAFLAAESVPALIAARILQGFATGTATSVLAAALLDAAPAAGPLGNALTPPLGMALGALGTAALAAYAPWPLHLVYALCLAAFVLQAVLIWTLPETAARRPGAWASLRPRIAVPPRARRALWTITPANLAIWGVGGFFLSLVPSLVRAATDIRSTFAGGLVVAALTLSGAIGILTLRRKPAADALVSGSATLTLGSAAILAAVHLGSLPLLLGGSLIAGFGWGAGFLGGLRTIMPLAAPEERAGLMAAYYIQSYLAMSVPAILAGILVRQVGLIAAANAYCGGAIALAATGTLIAAAERRKNAVQMG